MQIIPSTIMDFTQSANKAAATHGDAGQLLGQSNTSAAVKQSGGPFAALIAKVEESIEQPEAQPGASLRSILLQKGKSGSTPDLRDTKLTEQDFESIKESLKKLGVSDKMLSELESQAAEGGLTWNGLLGTLTQHPDFRPSVGSPQKLDSVSQNNVTAFMQKLGMTPTQTKEVIATMERGEVAPAWQAIVDKMAKLTPEQKITISASDAQGLAKALQLDKDSTQKLVSTFSKLEGQELTPKQLSSALAEVSTSIQQRQQKADTRFSTLRDALKPAMEQAWERSSHLEASDARASKETLTSLTLMKDEVTAEANGFGKSAVSTAGNKEVTREARSDAEHSAFNASSKNAKATGLAATKDSKDATGQAAANAATQNTADKAAEVKSKNVSPDASGKTAQFTEATALGNRKTSPDADGGNNTPFQQQNNSSSGKNDAWTSMLGRVAVLDNSAQFQNTTTTTSNSERPNLHQQVFDQVQNGMMRTLKNGGKQMTLKLNPEELGSVTVILSVKNKEVSAIIKPESAEATKAVNEQISQLKQTLENQGLKVDRLEVRQELQHQNSDRQNWQGANQHNFTQEQAQRFLNQRRLGAMRAEGEDLARDMRKEVQRATSSAHVGLSIIA